jgi:hypothetical protein
MSLLALVYLPVVSSLRLVRHFLANQSTSFDTGIPPAYEVKCPTMVDQGGNGHHARVCSVRCARDLGPFACALLQQCITFVCELQHDGRPEEASMFGEHNSLLPPRRPAPTMLLPTELAFRVYY